MTKDTIIGNRTILENADAFLQAVDIKNKETVRYILAGFLISFAETVLEQEKQLTEVESEKQPAKIIKPFDLEAAKNGAKVAVRDGRYVSILRDNVEGDQPIVGLIHDRGEDMVGQWDLKGVFHLDSLIKSDLDLVIVEEPPVPKTYYVNVYSPSSGYLHMGDVHDTLEAAKQSAKSSIKTISFTI